MKNNLMTWATGTIAYSVLVATALVAFNAGAQTKEVEIGLIAPMSGPWARQGQVMKLAADMAIETINQQGGIKSMGGAKLKLSVFDAGDSVEKAKNAAQRMVADSPNLVGATGAYLSSFTLAVTEVTERAQLPVVTFSYSDLITSRGFKYVFQTSATGVQQAEGSLPALMEMAERASGKRPKTIGIVMDNTAASVAFVKPMKDHQLAKLGLKVGRDIGVASFDNLLPIAELLQPGLSTMELPYYEMGRLAMNLAIDGAGTPEVARLKGKFVERNSL